MGKASTRCDPTSTSLGLQDGIRYEESYNSLPNLWWPRYSLAFLCGSTEQYSCTIFRFEVEEREGFLG